MSAWSKQAYEGSLSSRCWQFTPYGEGWDRCAALREDAMLSDLVGQEKALSSIPPWAERIVMRSIAFPPFCPHAAFPLPYLDVLDVIGRQTEPGFVHGCYTVSRERKDRMRNYLFCLEAWLDGRTADETAADIAAFGSDRVDWLRACPAIWQVLGEQTSLKRLLIRRIIHRQRWWIDATAWDDDLGHGGPVDPSADPGDYGNPGLHDPYLVELRLPEVRQLEAELAATCPDWPWFRSFIHDSWLCAPKAFRFLERLLWCVGREKLAVALPSHPLDHGDQVPDFLQCRDTYTDTASGRQWVRDFAQGVRGWLADDEPIHAVAKDVHARLGERNTVKTWLAGLYLRRIELLNPYRAF